MEVSAEEGQGGIVFGANIVDVGREGEFRVNCGTKIFSRVSVSGVEWI